MSAFFYTVFANTIATRLFILAAIIAVVVLVARKWKAENADKFTAEERARKEEELAAFRKSVR